MRQAVRAIIIKDNKMLVMHRNKFGRVYDTLPGGNIAAGETHEQALRREMQDETSVQFKDPTLVFVHHAGDPYGDQYIYLCTYVSGDPTLSESSEEFIINKMGQNLYQPLWLSLDDLPKKPFVTDKLKEHILQGHRTEWPAKPVEISG